jgi:mevalonate kinase
MKRLIWLVILGVLGYLAYTQYVRTTSGEVAQVRHLEKEFGRATDRFISAMRSAGEPGLVILADPETAVRMVKDVRVKLQELMKTLTEEKAIDLARNLEDRILTFFKRHEIE